MLDLTTYKKRFFELKIDENTIINLKTPNKALINRMLEASKTLDGGTLTDNDLEKVYEIVADLLNNNKEEQKLNIEEVEKIFDDFDMIFVFFAEYTAWVSDNVNQKN